MNSLPLSIILPCYNPADGWLQNIEQNFISLSKQFNHFELIIVNDGSTKNFLLKEVEDLFSKYPKIKILAHSKNCGKGYALREGVEAASGEIIIYTDIDFPYTQESFFKIYAALINQNADVAIGIRGEEYYTHLPKTRVRISKLLRWFIKKFLRIPTDDTQCGLKAPPAAWAAPFQRQRRTPLPDVAAAPTA